MLGSTLIKMLNTNLLMCFEYNLFCFVSSLKYNTYAMCSISIVTDLSEHGWSREQECLQVVWDSPENLQKVQRTVDS